MLRSRVSSGWEINSRPRHLQFPEHKRQRNERTLIVIATCHVSKRRVMSEGTVHGHKQECVFKILGIPKTTVSVAHWSSLLLHARGGPRFKYQPAYQLFWPKFIAVFLSPFRQVSGIINDAKAAFFYILCNSLLKIQRCTRTATMNSQETKWTAMHKAQSSGDLNSGRMIKGEEEKYSLNRIIGEN